MTTKKRESRQFAPEFRAQAGQLVIKEGVSPPKAAEDLGMPLGTLYAWLEKFRSGQWLLETGGPREAVGKAAVKNGRDAAAKALDEQRRIQDLERQVRRLTLEREILKKAMAYCIEIPK